MQLGTGGGSISHAALSAGIGEGFDDDARPQGRKWDDEDDGKYLSTTTLRQQYLDYLVTKMPEIEKTVLSLYYHEELTLREIAKVVKLHESRISQLKSHESSRLPVFWPAANQSMHRYSRIILPPRGFVSTPAMTWLASNWAVP